MTTFARECEKGSDLRKQCQSRSVGLTVCWFRT